MDKFLALWIVKNLSNNYIMLLLLQAICLSLFIECNTQYMAI